MTDKKTNPLDDIAEGVRRLLDELEQLISPEKRQKRAPVPVPVRVRPDPHDLPKR